MVEMEIEDIKKEIAGKFSKDEPKKKAIPKKMKISKVSRIPIHWKIMLAMVVGALLITFIMDVTWAYYISSYPWVIVWLAAALIIGWFLSADLYALRGMGPIEAATGVGAVFVAVLLPLVLTFIHAYVAIVVVIAFFIYAGRRAFKNRARALMALKGYGGLFCVSLLIIGGFNPMLNPSGVENPMFDSLEENETSLPQTKYVVDLDEIRVISWDLGTQYLQRAYGDSAAVLETDPWVLSENTDPSYVNGKFVWVNAPQYEAWKWFGDKNIEFFVYVVNEPEKMTSENPEILNKVEVKLNVHKERIEWKDRIWNLMFQKYAGQYEVSQIRIDMDDDFNPYWIVYLSERGVIYNLPTLKKIVIVDVEDLSDYEEFDIEDLSSIPDWLEVIYPDKYVYEWIDYWGSYRKGLVYSWFNKKHLYDPDDTTVRFLIIENTTFWQITMRQKDSEVLGGFIQVNTRTGEAVFYNRESKSYVSKWTVEQQITSYLSSGELGFQQLSIHEGYLYPIMMNDGSVREAYIFPLYAGFTVQKYAVVDAEFYTAAPYIDTSLEDVLERYKARSKATNTTNLTWQTHKLLNAYADAEVVVVTLEGEGTHTVSEDDLRGGLITNAEDEWLELKIATAEHARTGNETIDVALDAGKIVDVDYLKADLIVKP